MTSSMGLNVELVNIKDKQNIEARFFEREWRDAIFRDGSCASAVAAITAKQGSLAIARATLPRSADGTMEGEIFCEVRRSLSAGGSFSFNEPRCQPLPDPA